MKILFWSALVLQVTALLFDEFHYHWKRGLPKWERWGHPVDTFFFLLALSVPTFFAPEVAMERLFIGLSVLSCLVITKDEWVHRDQAPAGEQWLHSVLFILHPVVLLSMDLLWKEQVFIPYQAIFFGVGLFFIYQIGYWNFYANRIFEARLRNY